jgi:hypothetical protein
MKLAMPASAPLMIVGFFGQSALENFAIIPVDERFVYLIGFPDGESPALISLEVIGHRAVIPFGNVVRF